MIIAKQMDVRSNIKEYFDLAYNGEAIVIPRKQGKKKHNPCQHGSERIKV